MVLPNISEEKKKINQFPWTRAKNLKNHSIVICEKESISSALTLSLKSKLVQNDLTTVENYPIINCSQKLINIFFPIPTLKLRKVS